MTLVTFLESYFPRFTSKPNSNSVKNDLLEKLKILGRDPQGSDLIFSLKVGPYSRLVTIQRGPY